MEGGVTVADKAEFKECLRLSWTQPYILQLVLSAGIGGLLFGYDTGVISGALLYIRDDFAAVEKSTVLRETIVSMAVAGAIVGAAFGGWMNDKFGRRPSIIIADALFFAGAVIMAFSPTPNIIIVGRVFVGLGVGMASMTAPLYISEASPARIRGALVSTNGLLITGGQFLAYLINLAFTKVPGTWRWMLGIAGVPALVQFVLMLMLPESPRWLYRKGRKEEAAAILQKIYPANEVEQEIDAMRRSVEEEVLLEGSIGEHGLIGKLRKALGSKVVRRGLLAGVIVQVAQQFVGINTVMYYSPTIVQLAGYASNNTAMALSLITSGLNAIGSIVSMFFVDRAGRRRLMLISLVGIVVWLAVLGGTFLGAAHHAPPVSDVETRLLANQTQTCPEFNPNVRWSCMNCLKATSTCGFCAHQGDKLLPGACLVLNDASRHACRADHREFYTEGCPNNFGWLALIGLGAYIVSYSPGMGTVPWIINSEIYPLRFRGICGGIAAVANWVSNLIVTQTFLSLTKALGTSATFFLFCCVSFLALIIVFLTVPETKGLQFEEVERMLERKDYKPWKRYHGGSSIEPAKNSRAPIKVKIFLWLAFRRRHWTNDRRARHGLEGREECYLCDQAPETIDHLLTCCPYAREVWFFISSALGWPLLPSAHTVRAWWRWLRARLQPSQRKGFDSLFALVSWQLWKERNARCFRESAAPAAKLLLVIKARADLWVQAGAKRLGSLLSGG